MNNLVAITIGDINGIGIRLILKLYNENKIKNFVLVTNINYFKKFLKTNNISLNINVINQNKKNNIFKKDCFNVYSFKSNSNEDNTLSSIKISHKLCIKEIFIGMITLPIRKDLIIKKLSNKFIGHTEYLKNLENKKFCNMILYHKKIIVSPLTTHIRLRSVSNSINQKLLLNQILNLNNILRRDFAIKNPKIAVSGINPHAGENGKIGNEETKIINPVIKKLLKKNIKVYGPLSGDSMLIKKNIKNFDCFLFMFHDQALIPFKIISNFSGVNYTGNLDIIRTSPDHGTAYDLIKSKEFSYQSILNCFHLINKIRKNRIKNDKTKKIVRSEFSY